MGKDHEIGVCIGERALAVVLSHGVWERVVPGFRSMVIRARTCTELSHSVGVIFRNDEKSGLHV